MHGQTLTLCLSPVVSLLVYGQGDHVLVAVRAYQTDKCDIFHKYMPDEVLRLVHLGELDPALAGVEDADVVTGEDIKDGELDIDKI